MRIGLIIIFGFCSIAGARTRELSLQQVWQILLENNRTIQQARLTVEQNAAQLSIQKSDFLPVLQFGHSTNYISKIAQINLPFALPGVGQPTIDAGVKDQYDFNLSLNQPVFTGFRTINLVKAVAAQHTASNHELQQVQNQLLTQAGQLFYGIQSIKLQQQILQKAITRTDVLLQQIKDLLTAQQTTAFDTLEAANRKLKFQNQLQNLHRMENIQLSKLRRLINIDEAIQVQQLGENTLPQKLETVAHFQRLANQNRPELQQLHEAIQASEFSLKAIRSSLYPQIYAGASYHYARPGVDFFQNEWMDYYTLGIKVQWQLWAGGKTRKKIQKARLQSDKLRLKRADMQNLIQQQVEETWLRLQNTREQIALQKKLVAQEGERYRLVKERYQQGQVAASETNVAEVALTQAELQLQAMQIDWHVLQLQMQNFTGTIGRNIN